MSAHEGYLRVWSAGRDGCPGVALEVAALVAYLDARGLDGGAVAGREADLYLACACAVGAPGAAELFVKRFIERVPAYLGRRASSADVVAELQQRVAVRALVGDDGGPPAIAAYRGRGSLEGWVRMVVLREALMHERANGRRGAWERALDPGLEDDGELAYLKSAYREPFRRAVAAAAAALAPEQRALLRLHYLEGLTTAQLAEMRRVSRPTIVRRLAEAREALGAGVERELGAALGLPPDELDSVLALVRSQLDVSLVRLLRDLPPPG